MLQMPSDGEALQTQHQSKVYAYATLVSLNSLTTEITAKQVSLLENDQEIKPFKDTAVP
jgi:hypothetical protein